MNWKSIILLLAFSTAALAVEDPPNCALAHGGLGNTSQGGLNFGVNIAHVGDTVSLFPALGMVSNACNCINATGSIYIATGFLAKFLDNVTLYPTGAVFCPSGAQCSPGPYSFVITTPMVGAGVSSPLLTIGGSANRVKAIENGIGTVTAGAINEQLSDIHTASTLIVVHPCLQVFDMCGASSPTNISFTGYVMNCGDVTMTNIIVTNNRTTSLFNLDGTPLLQPFSLTSGSSTNFKGNFTPFGSETATATNTMIVSGKDTTTIGGPNASSTNTVTTVCDITPAGGSCTCPCMIWNNPIEFRQYAFARRYRIFAE